MKMSQPKSISELLNKLGISKPEPNSDFSDLIEEIAKTLKLSLAGKCYMSIFSEERLYINYKQVTTDSGIKYPSKLFISRLNLLKPDKGNKAWIKYYNLLEKFGLPKGRQNYFA
jgi:hypothetical protein